MHFNDSYITYVKFYVAQNLQTKALSFYQLFYNKYYTEVVRKVTHNA